MKHGKPENPLPQSRLFFPGAVKTTAADSESEETFSCWIKRENPVKMNREMEEDEIGLLIG